jgi:ABC-type nitrate/sulfonate/bicarbonate transport system permease component
VTALHAGEATPGDMPAQDQGRPEDSAARRLVPPLILVAVLIGSWELACRALGVDPIVLPAPSRILGALWDARAVAAGHTLTTLGETVVGFGASVVLAVAAALVMDQVGWVRRAVYPLLVTSQTIPIVAVAPLLVLWFGIGLLPKVIVVILVTFFPITVALRDGLASTSLGATDLLVSMGASGGQQLRKLRLPGALPAFFTGLRIAVTYAVIAAIFGEAVGATNGLGIWIVLSKNLFRTDLVFAAILVTAVLTLVLWGLVDVVERVAIPWHRASRRARR